MPSDTPQPGWTYKPGDTVQPGQSPQPEAPDQAVQDEEPAKPTAAPPKHGSKPAAATPASGTVSWTASEFVANHKNASWYIVFIAGIAVCSGLIVFLTKDVISAAVIGFAGILFAMLASHKPRELAYKIDSEGITIGEKFYPFSLFKSFGVSDEGAIGSINLLPLKRFMPELSIYYPPGEEDKILDIVVDHLPHEQREEHGVDRLLRKIRF